MQKVNFIKECKAIVKSLKENESIFYKVVSTSEELKTTKIFKVKYPEFKIGKHYFSVAVLSKGKNNLCNFEIERSGYKSTIENYDLNDPRYVHAYNTRYRKETDYIDFLRKLQPEATQLLFTDENIFRKFDSCPYQRKFEGIVLDKIVEALKTENYNNLPSTLKLKNVFKYNKIFNIAPSYIIKTKKGIELGSRFAYSGHNLIEVFKDRSTLKDSDRAIKVNNIKDARIHELKVKEWMSSLGM